jgi:hypothetical protein
MFIEPSSFTIEFPEHLAREKEQYCIDFLTNYGGSVEALAERRFRIVCSKRPVLAKVGWALFHTHFKDLCRVVAVSGSAENRKTPYTKPTSRD